MCVLHLIGTEFPFNIKIKSRLYLIPIPKYPYKLFFNTTTYQRNKEPRRRPPGIEGGANPISTTQFHALNLGNSPHLNMNEKYGLAKVNAVYESKLSNLENRLKAISSEMGENDEIYHLNSKKVINQMNQNQKGTNKNMNLYFDMLAKIKILSSKKLKAKIN